MTRGAQPKITYDRSAKQKRDQHRHHSGMNAAREWYRSQGTISVQVLNEFAAVAIRKLKMPVSEVREILDTVRAVCDLQPVTIETHDRALAIVERYGFSLYDSLLIAAALLAGSKRLYCEDLQHDQLIDRQLRVVNPFIAR